MSAGRWWRVNPPFQEAMNLMTKLATTAKCRIYRIFCTSVLGLPLDSLAVTRTEVAFKNLLLHDLDAMMYYFDTDIYYKNAPISLPGDHKDMATIFAHLTLLLVGADACTPHIINSVWEEDEDARLALGGPCGDLSLIRRRLHTHSKVAINTVHIWITNSGTPILAPTSDSFDRLPSTLWQLLLQSNDKLVFARKPVPRGGIYKNTCFQTHSPSKRTRLSGIPPSYSTGHTPRT